MRARRSTGSHLAQRIEGNVSWVALYFGTRMADTVTPGGGAACDSYSAAVMANATPSRPPRRHLLQSCRIEGHVIQKSASPRKKALDPLRYIPERAAYYALFTLVARFEDDTNATTSGSNTSEHQVYRTYKQFLSLHTKLLKTYPKSKLPQALPSMRKKRYDNEYIEKKRQELNAYLDELMTFPEIKACKIFRQFLEDSNLSDSSEEDDLPTLKMLEGRPGTVVTVRAGQSFSVSLNLEHAGDVVSWQFTTKKHNIGFSATFNGESVRVYSREDSHLKPVKGIYKCEGPGVCTLSWDNTYTWSKGKVLVYWAEVEHARTASTPALGSSHLQTDAANTGPSLFADSRRSGYIAQSRNPGLYPRRIVNTSISLITKPFASGKNHHQQEFKSGLLIIERSVKFRGRHWYRKWFVLDTRKAILRYYDSELAARRGLSLAKLKLSTKHASLTITTGDESAPTAHMFVVRTRKRCWKICASSAAEYNEWEHAITTAIFTAQLSRQDLAHLNDGSSSVDAFPMGNPLLQDNGAGDSDDDDDEEEEEEGEEEDEEEAREECDEESEGEIEGHQLSAKDIVPCRQPEEPAVLTKALADGTPTAGHTVTKTPASITISGIPDLQKLALPMKILMLLSLNVVLYILQSLSWFTVAGLLALCNGSLIIVHVSHKQQRKFKNA